MPTTVRQDRTRWPSWVRLGLWGINTRKDAIYGWITIALSDLVCILIAAPSLFYWLSHAQEGIQVGFAAFWLGWFFLAAVLMLVSVVWYWAALRWVDRHGRWS